MSTSPISSSPGSLPLEAFTRAAEQGGDIYLEVAGDRLRVLASGSTPDGRSVAWVDSGADATAAFMQALASTYGNPVSRAVEREMGLAPSPGKPLSARAVAQAVEMAQTTHQALQGVDFVTALAVSARSDGVAFRETCAQLGLDPGSLGAERRQAIDRAMHARFEEAAAAGRSPVGMDTARAWLADLLRS